jgi:hypothetical protein
MIHKKILQKTPAYPVTLSLDSSARILLLMAILCLTRGNPATH